MDGFYQRYNTNPAYGKPNIFQCVQIIAPKQTKNQFFFVAKNKNLRSPIPEIKGFLS